MSRLLAGVLALCCVACTATGAQTGSLTATAVPTPTEIATPTAVPSTPTPAAYSLIGTITAPRCLAGYDIVGANVTIRDETNTIVGAGVTEYVGHPGLLAYERGQANPAERGPDVAFYALWDALADQGPIEKGSREDGLAIRSVAAFEDALVRRGNPPLRENLERYDPRLWFWAKALAAKNEQQERQVLKDIFQVDDLDCHATFTSRVTPARFYQFRIGTHDAPTFAFDELRSRDFRVALTLGQH